MTHPVQTGELTTEKLEQAWPLIREIAQGVSLESWCAFARSMIDPAERLPDCRGIVVAERKSIIRGLVTYETIDDLVRGRLLLLRNAVIMDLALREPIAEALFRRSDEVARQIGCTSHCLELTPQMIWIGDVWKRCAEQGGLPVQVMQVAPPFVDKEPWPPVRLVSS